MKSRGVDLLERSVKARLVERFIFNFRLAPATLQKHLPVTWLEPQIINGYSVVSFCILRLKGLMISQLPSKIGFETVSCAYRCGVMDLSEPCQTPSVYIIGRNTDRALITLFGPLLFQNALPKIRTSIVHGGDAVNIDAKFLDGGALFSAEVKISAKPSQLESEVFDSVDEFVKFIGDGKSSYAPSIHNKNFSRVDLYKEDSGYEALDVTLNHSWLDDAWHDAGLTFDSALRAGGGGKYEWTYLGQYDENTMRQSNGSKLEILQKGYSSFGSNNQSGSRRTPQV